MRYILSKYSIKLFDNGRCHIKHQYAEAEIVTDLPPEYGGNGQSFSSTDLVTAALGSCTLTTIDKIIEREGYNPRNIEISVTKTLAHNPNRISSIKMEIFYPEKLSDQLLQKLKIATKTCPVKRSLNDNIQIDTIFFTGGDNRD